MEEVRKKERRVKHPTYASESVTPECLPKELCPLNRAIKINLVYYARLPLFKQ